MGINPLVNTQFQYLDVGVNIDITPKVHAAREVTLKVSMDISSVTGQSNIGGISQPVIGQRKIEHEIRLKEGEVNILGGILEDQDIRSLNGIPGLAQIPILKYLFAQSNVEHKENEIVFALIPHIIRAREVTDLNEKALEVGTAAAIELRRAAQQPAAAPAADTPAPAPAAQAPNAAAPVQAAQPDANAASFAFDPVSVTQPAGSTFAVNVMLKGASNVYSVPLQVTYDPKLLQVVQRFQTEACSRRRVDCGIVHRDDDSTGTLQISATAARFDTASPDKAQS